jgi:uncharacterized protein (DUF1330 family)
MKHLPAFLALLAAVLGCTSTGDLAPTNTGSSGAPAAAASQTPEAPPVKVTARELVKAYKENELAADQRFGDRWLEISGKIDDISEVVGQLIISLEGSEFTNVTCTFPESQKASLMQLKAGQTRAFICRNDGMTANLYVGLSDCRVAGK